jgi:hypothetical protein
MGLSLFLNIVNTRVCKIEFFPMFPGFFYFTGIYLAYNLSVILRKQFSFLEY